MFIGPHKVAETEVLENGAMLVSFEETESDIRGKYTPSSEVYSMTLLEHVQTEEVSDYTELDKKRRAFLVKELKTVLLHHAVQIDAPDGVEPEVSKVLSDLVREIQNAHRASVDLLWGKNRNITFYDLHETLLDGNNLGYEK